MKKIVFFILLSIALFSNNSTSTLTIVRENVLYPPMEFYEDDKLTGFHIEIIEEVAKEMGIEICWVEVPWKRALYMVEIGTAEAITYIGKTPEREEWAIFKEGNILSCGTFSFLVRNKPDKFPLFDGSNLEEVLRSQTLLVVGGFLLPQNIRELDPEIHETIKISNLVDMLIAERYDLAMVNKKDYLNIYGGTSIEKRLKLVEPPVCSFANYIAFSKARNLNSLAERFEKEMIEFKKSDKYKELLNKYGM